MSTTGRKAAGVAACALAVVLAAVGPARAADDKVIEELKARLDRLEKQNEELRKLLKDKGLPDEGPKGKAPDGPPEDPVQSRKKVEQVIGDYLKERDAARTKEEQAKAKRAEEEGYEVGQALDFKFRWNHGLWGETADKAFRFHVGGRTQIDGVWVHANQGVQAPLAVGGIGEFDDAVNFRRGRFAMEGTIYEVFDFNCEYDFVNTFRFIPVGVGLGSTAGTVADRLNVANTPVPTDLWFQFSQLPYVGHVRVGNQKPWIAFEHLTSSRFLNFLERSLPFDAFVENGNNGFTFGASAWDSVLNDRLFWGVGVYKPNFRDIFGWNVGDGEYQVTGRVAGTPYYKEDGRYLVHLGLGYSHSTADDGVFRYRARNLLRNGPALLHPTFAIIQTAGRNGNLLVPEFVAVNGPFHVAAEYYASWVDQDGAFQNVGNRTTGLPPGNRGELFYQGGYVEAGYFLTGESRAYDKVIKAFTRQIPLENAFLVDGDGGRLLGRGAWQVVARYSWIDLDSKGVNGGKLHDLTLGVNWYLCGNAKVQWNYELGYRDAGVSFDPTSGLRSGTFQGFGTRLAFDW